MKLKRESSTPLYIQLKNSLQTEINAGRYQPNQRLLSERELCDRFKVSRMTVRQALSELMREGVLYSRIGKGTYVSEAKINQELKTLVGFSQDITARGRQHSSRVLKANLARADLQQAKVLNLQTAAEIVVLSRLRMVNEVPMCIETAYIPHALCPGLLAHDFSTESLYRVFEHHYHLRLVRAEQSIEAGLGAVEELALLQMEPPGALLRISRVTYTDQDVPVEFVLSVYRGDLYKFHTTLHTNQ